jgi:hypothetical protein
MSLPNISLGGSARRHNYAGSCSSSGHHQPLQNRQRKDDLLRLSFVFCSSADENVEELVRPAEFTSACTWTESPCMIGY